MSSSSAQGAIACGHTLTARAAEAMLRDGGNAVDAAIAAVAAACVVEPVLAGPAGGGFAMLHTPDSDTPRLCDFFCHTPRRRNTDARMDAALADFGDATQVFHIGPGSVAASGLVNGLHALHQRHGRLPWRALFTPAIELAERGHAISAFQARLLRIIRPIVTHTPAARRLFAPTGDLLQAGDTLRNPAQARFWRLIADAGLDAWRQEVCPVLLVHAGHAAGGHLAEDDLLHHEVHWRSPLQLTLPAESGTADPARIWLNPPPAASGVLIALAFDHLLRNLSTSRANLPLAAALALRHADTLRHDAGHDLVRLITHLPRAWRGTTHISVVDHQGISCAITVSNGEGNGALLEDFGFMPNNMLGEEDVNPAGMAFAEGVRMSSMMCPAIARHADGTLVALGSGGSNRIRSALLLVLARLLLTDTPLAEAVSAPRLHVEADMLDIEPGLPDALLRQLRDAFPRHRLWSDASMFFGGVHAVQRRADGAFAAAADFRRDGATRIIT